MIKKYPLAETFFSLQGEGHWVGYPMFFIRLAGCSVGTYDQGSDKPATCHTYLGNMVCDTDYRYKFSSTADDLIRQCTEREYDTICLTGGEPCDQDLTELIEKAHMHGIRIHLETSGTVNPSWLSYIDWLAVSPKKGWLTTVVHDADEIRFLWDPLWSTIKGTEIDAINEVLKHAITTNLFVSPVNAYNVPREDSIKEVMRFLNDNPQMQFRLSVQLHKYLDIR